MIYETIDDDTYILLFCHRCTTNREDILGWTWKVVKKIAYANLW